MKTVFAVFGIAAMTSANIVFNHVPLKCSVNSTQMYHGCLRAQECTHDGECVPVDITLYPTTFRSEPPDIIGRQTPAYSTDGKCGPAHGNTICDPNSKLYTGGCCSQYGWCGNDDDHCGAGCLSGCTSSSSSGQLSARSDGLCGPAYGDAICDPSGPYGGCCSKYGYCGSTPQHCLLINGCQYGCTGENEPPSTPPRADGQCGIKFNGATCDPNGAYGRCCSQYGYCGSTPEHCLLSNGCQNGCDGSLSITTGGTEPTIGPVTTPGSGGAPTTDGTCGSGNGITICGNWPNGNCCSMYGFCGNTNAHCGAGCQSGNCLGAPVVSAPGPSPAPAASVPGNFAVIGQSGVPAMHAGLMSNGRVFFLDKLENYTQLETSDGYYAMSSEYDPETNTVVPLAYLSNAFCSGGSYLPDGRVVNVGGNAPLTWLDPNIGDGFSAIRFLDRSSTDASLDGKGWNEPGNKLASARWYATAQTMPDGTVFVASGSLNGLDPTVLSNNNPTYEILSPQGVSQGDSIPMDILIKNQPYYMYPFVHLLNNGNLFVFVSKACQIFNVADNAIVRELPELPGDFRTYPNTGGSVLLPLSSANGWAPDIIICGGGAYQDITSPTDPSCGRMQPLSANPQWEMDSMPEGRGMVEGTLLPDGTVIWLNGGNRGAQGFGLMDVPTLEALHYNPAQPLGQRWTTCGSSDIPRLYHSVALLLPDGTIMIAGSNPVQMPILQPDAADPYVTEFRVERFTPPYLQNGAVRPSNVLLSTTVLPVNSVQFIVKFTAPPNSQSVKVVLYHGGFVTHSVHMGARMLELDYQNWIPGGINQQLVVTGPPNHNVAPPGPYLIFVLTNGVPGIGQFVSVA